VATLNHELQYLESLQHHEKDIIDSVARARDDEVHKLRRQDSHYDSQTGARITTWNDDFHRKQYALYHAWDRLSGTEKKPYHSDATMMPSRSDGSWSPGMSSRHTIPTIGRDIPTDVRDMFNRFDYNRSGRMDYQELRNCLNALGVDVSHQGAANVLHRYDRDGNGLLDVEEFSGIVKMLRERHTGQSYGGVEPRSGRWSVPTSDPRPVVPMTVPVGQIVRTVVHAPPEGRSHAPEGQWDWLAEIGQGGASSVPTNGAASVPTSNISVAQTGGTGATVTPGKFRYPVSPRQSIP
jgi:hypothetical protein